MMADLLNKRIEMLFNGDSETLSKYFIEHEKQIISTLNYFFRPKTEEEKIKELETLESNLFDQKGNLSVISSRREKGPEIGIEPLSLSRQSYSGDSVKVRRTRTILDEGIEEVEEDNLTDKGSEYDFGCALNENEEAEEDVDDFEEEDISDEEQKEGYGDDKRKISEYQNDTLMINDMKEVKSILRQLSQVEKDTTFKKQITNFYNSVMATSNKEEKKETVNIQLEVEEKLLLNYLVLLAVCTYPDKEY